MVTVSSQVLRWVYGSSTASCYCTLSFDADQLLYAFCVCWEGRPQVCVEWFPHVTQAFERQIQFEADLLRLGLSLEDFSTLPATRADSNLAASTAS